MLFATGWSGDTTVDFLVGGESFRNSLIKLAGTCKSLRNICKYLTFMSLRAFCIWYHTYDKSLLISIVFMCFVVVLSLSHPHSITLRTPQKLQCTVLALCQEELILLSLLSFYSSILLIFYFTSKTVLLKPLFGRPLTRCLRTLRCSSCTMVCQWYPWGCPSARFKLIHLHTHKWDPSTIPCRAMPCHVIYTVLCRRPSCYWLYGMLSSQCFIDFIYCLILW